MNDQPNEEKTARRHKDDDRQSREEGIEHAPANGELSDETLDLVAGGYGGGLGKGGPGPVGPWG